MSQNQIWAMNFLELIRKFPIGFIVLIFGIGLSYSAQAQQYKITVKLKNYNNDTLLLGYHFGDKQYIRDTAFRKNNEFIFSRDTVLETGMYLVVTKPNHDYFQILVDPDNQKFSVESDNNDLNGTLKFKGTRLNVEFNEYIDFLGEKRIIADSISNLLKSEQDSSKRISLQKAVELVDESVKAKQKKIIKSQPHSLLTLILKWSIEPEIPKFDETSPEKVQQLSFDYYKENYFNLIDFKDDRTVRLPLFMQKIERYIQRLTVQHPDSISLSLDYILSRQDEKSESFKFCLSHFLNTYASSKYVGMDAVYVHLVEQYYAKGKAPWIDPENLAKMVSDAKALKPLLIDRIAPDISLITFDSVPISLHSIKSEYLVLIFWAPDCGHCKKSMPALLKFYSDFKSKGIEVLAVCSHIGTNSKSECQNAMESLHMQPWINAYDPQHKSRFKIIYDLKTTPQIYILDADKRILTKKIAAEQLEEVMNNILKINN